MTLIAVGYTAAITWFGLLLQILILGYEPKPLVLGAFTIMPLSYLALLCFGHVVIQERLMRARRRAHSWVRDPIDHVLTWGSVGLFGFAVFLAISGGYLGRMSSAQQVVLALGVYFAYDAIFNTFLGKRIDEMIAQATHNPAAMPNAQPPSVGADSDVDDGTQRTHSIHIDAHAGSTVVIAEDERGITLRRYETTGESRVVS